MEKTYWRSLVGETLKVLLEPVGIEVRTEGDDQACSSCSNFLTRLLRLLSVYGVDIGIPFNTLVRGTNHMVRLSLSYSQKIVVLVLLVLTTALLILPFTSKPISIDEMWYMDLALFPEADPQVLNRYGHIYLLKLFIWLCGGDVFLGARVFWSALLAVTVGAMGVLLAALPSPWPWRTVLLALLLLATHEMVFATIGLAYVDYTLMMLMVVSTTIMGRRLLQQLDLSFFDAFWLGFLCFCAVKVKETGVALAILPMLFTRDRRGAWRWDKITFSLACAWLIGVSVALGLLLVLDAIFLGDAWYSMRPESLRGMLAFNVREVSLRSSHNVFAWLLSSGGSLAFVLYLISLLQPKSGEDDHRWAVLQALPLVFFSLLLVLSAITFEVEPRYLIPIAPLFALWAAFFLYRLGLEEVALSRWFVVLLFAILGAKVVEIVVYPWGYEYYLAKKGWSAATFHAAVILPSVLAGIFLVFLFFRGQQSRLIMLLILLLLVGSWNPLRSWIHDLATRKVYHKGEKRFNTFALLKRVVPEDNPIILLSPELDSIPYALIRTQGHAEHIVRIMLNYPLPRTHILFQRDFPQNRSVAYALGTRQDINNWLTAVQQPPVSAITNGETILLCFKRSCGGNNGQSLPIPPR